MQRYFNKISFKRAAFSVKVLFVFVFLSCIQDLKKKKKV